MDECDIVIDCCGFNSTQLPIYIDNMNYHNYSYNLRTGHIQNIPNCIGVGQAYLENIYSTSILNHNNRIQLI